MNRQDEFDLFGPAKTPDSTVSREDPRLAAATAQTRRSALSRGSDEEKRAANYTETSRQSGEVSARPLSVGELTSNIRRVLEAGFGEVWVAGEISNLRRQASGHQYFTLKDDNAQLACVLFRGAALRTSGIRLADGQQVEVRGDLTVYEARGQYQVIVRSVVEMGRGRLYEQFEALKRKLEAEGLFDTARKRTLPAFPRRIALVTSPTGAAIRDMLDVLQRRAPWIEVVVAPVRVQGAEAAAEIARMLARLNAWSAQRKLVVDAIIVGRGGGSLEDLWAFNEEIVARAIVACSLPVVSAVGHETDFTIADFVADIRAPTPSAAAEIVSPAGDDLRYRLAQLRRSLDAHAAGCLRVAALQLERLQAFGLQRDTFRRISDLAMMLDDLSGRLAGGVQSSLDDLKSKLERLRERLLRLEPFSQLKLQRSALDLLVQRLKSSANHCLENRRSHVESLKAQIRLLGPQSTLDRGYTLTLDPKGRLLTSASRVTAGSMLITRFKDGEVASQAMLPHS